MASIKTTKTVLYISSNADEAGAPRHVEMLAKEFASRYRVFCVFGMFGPVADRLRNHNIPVHYVLELRNSINPINDLIAIIKIFFLVIKISPDIIHCHSAKAGVVGRIVSLFTSVRCIYTVHGWGWRGVSGTREKIIKFAENLLGKIGGVRYIYVAGAVQSEAVQILNIPVDKGCVVFNGVSDVIIETKTVESNGLTLFMAARVCDAKDHITLLEAFRRVDTRFRLVLCGAGTDSVSFKAMAKEIVGDSYSRVKFIGNTSCVEKYFVDADIYLLISHFEALPLSIIEAMAYGLPTIATRVGGVGELVDDGMNGYLVEKGDVDGLVQRIHDMVDESQRLKLGSNARKVYCEKFTIKKMLDSVENCYENCYTDKNGRINGLNFSGGNNNR